MEWSQRVVISTPLTELWTSSGPVDAKRIRTLSHTAVAALLQQGVVEFAIADPGQVLRWVRKEDCYSEWKSNIKSHIAEPNAKIAPEFFPGAYCFLASEWRTPSGRVIVLLESFH